MNKAPARSVQWKTGQVKPALRVWLRVEPLLNMRMRPVQNWPPWNGRVSRGRSVSGQGAKRRWNRDRRERTIKCLMGVACQTLYWARFDSRGLSNLGLGETHGGEVTQV